jgi:hypothetical protein
MKGLPWYPSGLVAETNPQLIPHGPGSRYCLQNDYNEGFLRRDSTGRMCVGGALSHCQLTVTLEYRCDYPCHAWREKGTLPCTNTHTHTHHTHIPHILHTHTIHTYYIHILYTHTIHTYNTYHIHIPHISHTYTHTHTHTHTHTPYTLTPKWGKGADANHVHTLLCTQSSAKLVPFPALPLLNGVV